MTFRLRFCILEERNVAWKKLNTNFRDFRSLFSFSADRLTLKFRKSIL